MTETTAPYVTDPYVADLEERLAALELALESTDWQLLSFRSEQEFSREGLRNIVEFSRIFYLKNPLVQRAVDVRRFYVWGQGWTVKASTPEVQAAIDDFLYDDKNDDVLGGHEARMQLEVELETDGNLFFVFFVNQATGRVRVRTIPFAEIEDVICNPEDSHEPWYYRRQWAAQTFDVGTGGVGQEPRTAYYPDWRYKPTAKPQTIAGQPVRWESPVYHVRVGGFSNWRFGMSEVYDLIDWAKAYKEFLEDWASIVRAYRRFAFQLTTPSAGGVAAAKAKFGTTLSPSMGETNPPPLTGSTFIASAGNSLQPIRTSGATVSADDGRRLLLMVAAGSGLPETFFGDANVGTLATAKSLDRPTELMMRDRQTLWRDVYLNILAFVQLWAVKAPQGSLRGLGRVETMVEAGQITEHVLWNEGVDGEASIEFPPLLEHDVPSMVGAMVNAATLGASGTLAGTIDLVSLSRLLLTALGVADADAIVDAMFPDGIVPEAEDTAPPGEERPAAESLMVAAVGELRSALLQIQEASSGSHD